MTPEKIAAVLNDTKEGIKKIETDYLTKLRCLAADILEDTEAFEKGETTIKDSDILPAIQKTLDDLSGDFIKYIQLKKDLDWVGKLQDQS